MHLARYPPLSADPAKLTASHRTRRTLARVCTVGPQARCWLVFSMLVAMGSLAGAIKIFVSDYANRAGCEGSCEYAGVALFVQCILIFVSSFVMRIGTIPGPDDYYP